MRKLTFICIMILTHCVVKAQWVKVFSESQPIDNLTSFCIKDNFIFIANRHPTIFRSSDAGLTWDTLYGSFPDNKQIQDIEAIGKYLVISSWHSNIDSTSGIYRSTDDGNNWSRVEEGIGHDVDAISYFHVKEDYLFGAHNQIGILVSSDSGNTWSYVNGDLPSFFTGLASDSKYLYGSTLLNGVYRSSNNGQAWTLAKSIKSLYTLASNDGYLFAGTAGSIIRSADSGLNWVDLNNGDVLPIASRAIAFNDNYLFAGTFSTDTGSVLYSKDAGNTWIDIAGNLGNNRVNFLFVKDNYLFAGIHSGVWRRSLQDLSVNKSNHDAGSVSILPNPATTFVAIEHNQVNCQLDIYDVFGRTFFHSNNENGRSQIITTGWADGVYFVKLASNQGTQIAKFQIINSK